MVHMILLIEHAADRRASIAHVLRRQGYVVLAVGDGALALEMAADNSISLVILDLSNLPSDGSKLYLRFRTSVKTAHVPILLLASNDAEGVQINEHGRCPDNILRHPFLWEELLACVQTQLRVAKRPRAKMLVIEQDTSIQDTLALALLREGYVVQMIGDGAQVLEGVLSGSPALIILDTISLQLHGMDICRQLRSCDEAARLPILLIINNISDIAQIESTGVHANDYLVQPYTWEELRACVRTLLRRQSGNAQWKSKGARPGTQAHHNSGEVLVTETLIINIDRQVITRGDQEIRLKSRLLFELLIYLAHHRGAVLTRNELLRQIWGGEDARDKHTVDVHMHWLRKTLQNDPDAPQLIETIVGVGYRFNG